MRVCVREARTCVCLCVHFHNPIRKQLERLKVYERKRHQRRDAAAVVVVVAGAAARASKAPKKESNSAGERMTFSFMCAGMCVCVYVGCVHVYWIELVLCFVSGVFFV